MNAIEKWLYGLFAAAIGAAGGAIPLIIIAPLTFNFTSGGLLKLGEACAGSALIAVGLYLKQSPLPGSLSLTVSNTPATFNSPATSSGTATIGNPAAPVDAVTTK